ncbi:hypothetical protein K2173_023291 [Erythroxylum novogranatense]|uniref:Uncharacterized protein n=1 Tax=Erythroxylum novogranatense TaxID=1862640 RepID=A0AAV8T8F9_9ROSI|nr:hypothetical protein K2173_023291 [Erythroxylum novogranatense]
MLKHGTRSKPWQKFQNSRLPVMITSLVLAILILVMIFCDDGKRTHYSFDFPVRKSSTFDAVQLHPSIEMRNGTDVIWQIPDSPKAVLFMAHGCYGRAINFWDRSPSCPNCIGLPEERLLVLHALAHKYAVLTISSAGRCWTLGDELVIVKSIIRWWIERNKVEKLPLVALGASSGGHFVSVLATSLRFSSITLLVAEAILDPVDISEDYPPTLFVHMPKDLRRRQKISEFVEIMKNKGIDVAEVECMEFPLSPNLLGDRIPGVDQTVSAKLFNLFRDKGFIDGNGYMKKDGRATRWKKAVLETENIDLDRKLFQHVQEELNLAFAYHEMTSLQSQKIFSWFESHLK